MNLTESKDKNMCANKDELTELSKNIFQFLTLLYQEMQVFMSKPDTNAFCEIY